MIALEAGRFFQSRQTGFIHWGDCIPLYENLCFSLALFRSHVGERVEEGKEMLRRLLPFYSEGFPLYLHEYPKPSTLSYQLRCALPLYWIDKRYHHVIEPPLKQQIRDMFFHLIDLDETALSPIYQILRGALLGKDQFTYCPNFSHEWGILLLVYQILDEKVDWILEEALKNWHPELMTYCGAPLQEYQRKAEPEVTLYELFMAKHQQAMSKRLLKFSRVHLQAALIFPFKQKKPLSKGRSLTFVRKADQKEVWSPKGFHLIRFLWGGIDQIYSLVCQENLCLERIDGDFLLTYPKNLPEEKRNMELSLYCSYHPDVVIKIGGKRQTVFYLGETIEIHTKGARLELTFSLEKGEGVFMGHISRGNRLSQVALTDSKDFSSYDWKIGLRTINRGEECTIRLKISV